MDIEDVKNKIKFVQLFIEKKEKQKEKQFENILTIKRSDSEYEKRLKKYKHTKFVLHQKKRRLRNLQQKLNRLKTDENQYNSYLFWFQKVISQTILFI